MPARDREGWRAGRIRVDQPKQCKQSAAKRVEIRDRSPIRRGEEGDDLEERITRVVMRVLGEKSAEAGQHAASPEGPGPSHVMEGRRKTGVS